MQPGSPLVSVVTPCYNMEEYLAECIESVLSQSYSNFEYIIVDNACTDRSSEIVREYARRDPRIRVVRNDELLPQVDNINLAIREISPESVYCKVVLADDWIFPDSLARMVALAEQHPRVGIVSGYSISGSLVKGAGLPYEKPVVTGTEACRLQLLKGRFMFGSPSTVLFRSEIVRTREPFYSAGRMHEDTEACYEILADWDFGFVHQVVAYLRVDARSTMGKVSSFNPFLLDKLILLRRYGPLYLEPAEYETGLRQVTQMYHSYLGESALARRPAEFWEYHRRGLATVGIRLSKRRVGRLAAAAAVRLLLNPLNAAETLLGRVRSRMRRS